MGGAGRPGPVSGGSDGMSAAARTTGQRTGGSASAISPNRTTGGASAAPQATKHAANDAAQSKKGGTTKEQGAVASVGTGQADEGDAIANALPSSNAGATQLGQMPDTQPDSGADAATSVDTGQASEGGRMATASAPPSGGTTEPGQMPAAPPDGGAGSAPSISTKMEDRTTSGSSGAGGLATGLASAARGLGVMSALSVPGMENAAYAGSPAPSAPPEAPSSDDFKGEASPSDPVNVIQPAADQSPPTKTAPPKE